MGDSGRDSGTKIGCSLLPGIGTLTLAMAICSYFVYGNSWGALLITLLIGLVTGFIVFVGFVPVGGPILFVWLAKLFINNAAFPLAGITWKWPISVIFWCDFAGAVILTLVTVWVLYALIRE